MDAGDKRPAPTARPDDRGVDHGDTRHRLVIPLSSIIPAPTQPADLQGIPGS
jgi:hypothetical protein